MSSCGGNCGCGPSCNCGSGCGRNPGLGLSETTTTTTTTTSKTIIAGVAPVKTEMPEMSTEGGHGCKCGSNCQCDPCNC
ncbi:hypothetical protein NL676_032719 [Syzygium grande]|nr:hypothetical protein NL676_032719 [Syzygium grande]